MVVLQIINYKSKESYKAYLMTLSIKGIRTEFKNVCIFKEKTEEIINKLIKNIETNCQQKLQLFIETNYYEIEELKIIIKKEEKYIKQSKVKLDRLVNQKEELTNISDDDVVKFRSDKYFHYIKKLGLYDVLLYLYYILFGNEKKKGLYEMLKTLLCELEISVNE